VKIFRLIKNVLWGNLKERDHLGLEGVRDWIDLARDRDRWREIVYMVMILHVP
jgi:hypothetical protein